MGAFARAASVGSYLNYEPLGRAGTIGDNPDSSLIATVGGGGRSAPSDTIKACKPSRHLQRRPDPPPRGAPRSAPRCSVPAPTVPT